MTQPRQTRHHSPSDSKPLAPTHNRKLYRRAAVLALATSVTLAPAFAAAQQEAQNYVSDTPAFNVEVFAKPGNERILGGIEAVIPFRRQENATPFVDLKAKIDDDDGHEFNIGLGYRALSASKKWLLGGYLAYDLRHTPADNDFNWLTGGFEALSRQYDFRLNYYHALDDEEIISQGAGFFSGGTLFRTVTFEEPMNGFDAEVGYLLPFSDSIESRIFLAGYHFSADLADDMTGGRVRLEMRPRKNIILGLEAQYDDVNDTQVFFELRFAFGHESKAGIRSLQERMVDPVHRDIDGPVAGTLNQATKNTPVMAKGTGAPARFIHIDNSNDDPLAQQNGSVDHPYSSLENYYAKQDANKDTNTYVIIHQGDGTTNGLDETLVLLKGQTVWGEGADTGFPIQGFGSTDENLWPQMVNYDDGSDTVIQLADNNEVSGLKIIPDWAQVGIKGENVTGFNIHHNVIRSDGAEGGILITNASGDTMTDRSVSGRVANNRIDTDGPAIVVANVSTDGSHLTQDVTISGNTLSSSGDSMWLQPSGDGGEGFWVRDALAIFNLDGNVNGGNATAIQKVTISGNTIMTDGAEGVKAVNIAAYDGAATQTVTLSGNTISSEYSGGAVFLNATDYLPGYGTTNDAELSTAMATQNVTISGNNLNADYDAIEIYNYGFAGDGLATQTATVTGNDILTDEDGVDFWNEADYGDATQTATVTGNTITAYDDGVQLENNDNDYGYYGIATQNINPLTGNEIYSDDEYGFNIENWGGVQSDITISANTVTSYDAGIRIEIYEATQGDITISGNTLNSTDNEGIYIYNDAGSTQGDITISDNTVNADEAGIAIYNGWEWGSAAQQGAVTITGNTVFSSDNYGIYVGNYDSTQGDIEIAGNTVNSYYNGIHVENWRGVQAAEVDDSGEEPVTTLGDITITNNTVTAYYYGIHVENDGGEGVGGIQGNITISGNTVVSTDDDGINIWGDGVEGAAGRQGDITISGNTVNSGDESVYLWNDTHSTQGDITIADNTTTSTDYEGLYVWNEGTQGDVSITGNTVSSEEEGIYVYNDNGASQGDIAISGNTVTSTDNDGIYVYNDWEATQGSVDIKNNTVSAEYDGIYVINYYGTSQGLVTISGNTIDAGEDGIDVNNDGDEASQTVLISGNTINSGGYGIFLDNYRGSQNGEVSDNSIDSLEESIEIHNYDGSQGNEAGTEKIVVSGNTINSNDDGIDIENDGGEGIQYIEISDNTINAVTDNGIELENWDNATQIIDNDGNDITTTGNGIAVYNSSYGTQDVTINGDTILAGEHGIIFDNDTGTQNGRITGNAIDSRYASIELQNYNGLQGYTDDDTLGIIETPIEISGNTIDSTADGIWIDGAEGAQGVEISDNTINANDSGLDIMNRYRGYQTITNDGNSITGNGYGIIVGNEGDYQNVTIADDTIRGNEDGIIVWNDYNYWDDGEGVQVVEISDSTITSSGQGIGLFNEAGNQFVSVDGNTVTSNGNGIEIANAYYYWSGGNGTQVVDITGNSVTSSGNNGIAIFDGGEGAAYQAVRLEANTINNNGYYGVFIDSLNNASQAVDLGGGEGFAVDFYDIDGNEEFDDGLAGSTGNNRIFDNGAAEIYLDSDITVPAQNNWWGTATPTEDQFVEDDGNIDYSSPLDEDPEV